jgi:hypothetical protein
MNCKPYYRCPCCGKLATAYAISRAGTHQLGIRRTVEALGCRGFRWSQEPLAPDEAGGIARVLAAALHQVVEEVTPPADLLRSLDDDLVGALALVRAVLRLSPVPPAEWSMVPSATRLPDISGGLRLTSSYTNLRSAPTGVAVSVAPSYLDSAPTDVTVSVAARAVAFEEE